MTQKQKELLLKDLCARLPYGVKCKYYDCCIGDFGEGTIRGFERHDRFEIDGVCIRVDDVRPYLFPLSSMSEEQKEFIKNQFCYDWDSDDPYSLWTYCIEIGAIDALIDVLNKYHIDYRGLIPMDLANDATGLNIY
jgi:hypothetical protein